MNNKTLEKLEFNKICQILKIFSITYIGKTHIDNLYPMHNKKEIEKSLKQVSDASTLLYRKGNIPLGEIEDTTEHIKKLNSNMFLTAKQLLDLANILQISYNLKDYFFNDELSKDINMTEFTSIYNLFNNLYTNIEIQNSIFNSIIDENTLSDNASKELYSIRKQQKSKETEIREKLNSYLHSKYIQEPVITIRSSRFVIPVKNEYRSEVKGFIHDISSSGSTVFIEPLSVFELNNDLNNLKNEENIEIQKILQSLSSLFFGIIDKIENDINLIGLIDFIFAKAKYSNSINGTEPIISDKKILNLKLASHPLIEKNIVIKNDILIGENYNSLIITGPNTGGKTVILKTAGLLTIMALSGLHIPAKEGSSVYMFDNVFADIGDEQSIQDSLSTFSSHITNISYILNETTENSLILLDELGSGTDPIEGSSLAISILENLFNKKALTISTTHYPEIKHYALITDGFENASVEFNLETLSPTYKLLIGVPGTSNAFLISKKLGISDEIISRAKTFIDENKINIEELLTNIYKDKQKIESEKETILKNSEEIKNLRKSLEYDFSELENKKKTIISDAKSEAKKILLSAKDDANDIIKDLEKVSSTKDANILRNKLNNKVIELNENNKNNNSVSNTSIPIKDLKIGMHVFVPKIDQNVTILSISKDGKIQVQTSLGKMYFEVQDFNAYNTNNNSNSKNSKFENKKDYSSKKEFKPQQISAEKNVIGQTVDEACILIDKYLDNCYLAGLNVVRIVHGKGTGALRKGVQEFLKTHPHVKSYRLGLYGEGESGVTVVELK